MAKTKHCVYSILALGGGFLGGLTALQLSPTVAAAAHATQTVRAEHFELVDQAGNRRALLEVTPDGMSDLILYDGRGHDRSEYRVARDGTATLGFFNDTGAHRALFGAAPNGRDGVSLYGAHGRLLAEMATDEHDAANITLYDPNTGRARAGLGVATTGGPALALFDEQGNDRAELHVTASGKPGLAFADETGKTVAGLPMEAAPHASSQQ